MSRKQKQTYIRKSFETRIPGKPTETHEKYVGMTDTLVRSIAWNNLSKKAMCLYLCMRLQYDGTNDKGFYFNRGMWLDDPKHRKNNYALFKSPNDFYKYRDELVTQGFIEVVESGKNTRTRAVYAFSDKWQKVQEKTTKHDMTKARNKLKGCTD